eukprot:465096-Pelagomonas_calceolata.AAC.1
MAWPPPPPTHTHTNTRPTTKNGISRLKPNVWLAGRGGRGSGMMMPGPAAAAAAGRGSYGMAPMVPGPGGMMPRPVGGAAPYARPPAMAPPAGYAGYGAPAPGACVGMHVLGVYVCMGEMYPLQQGFGAPSPS